MIIRSDIENAAAKQLSLDLCCNAADFFKEENTLTLPEKRDGRRLFTEEPPMFRAAAMGMGAVICAAEEIMPFAKLIASQKNGTQICSAAMISQIDRELFSHGCCIGIMNQYYLPRSHRRPNVRSEGYQTAVYEDEALDALYSDRSFSNALLYRRDGSRHDILAVCAVNGRRIMGIAGAAYDSSTMAQIGVDVLPEFRGMGIGSALVSLCAAEVFSRGYVPYYGTWSGNIISQRLVARCGFYPAWCEMFSVKLDRYAPAGSRGQVSD